MAQFGIVMQELIRSAPGNLGIAAVIMQENSAASKFAQSVGKEARVCRDLLPLTLEIKSAEDNEGGSEAASKKHDLHELKKRGVRCWLWIVMAILNGMAMGNHFKATRRAAGHLAGPPALAQTVAMQRLEADVAYFAGSEEKVIPSENWEKLLR